MPVSIALHRSSGSPHGFAVPAQDCRLLESICAIVGGFACGSGLIAYSFAAICGISHPKGLINRIVSRALSENCVYLTARPIGDRSFG